MAWKFFGRRKGEQLNVPPTANDNVVKFQKPASVDPLSGEFNDQQIMEMIARALVEGCTVIIVEPEDDGS